MNLEWMLIRGTGLVAYLLLAGSTIWGLLLSSKLLGRAVKAKGLTWLHEGLAAGSLLATGAHLFFLWADDFVEFGPRELFVPGASTWEPLSVAFGIMALYAAVIVSGSFYVKRWIGQTAWRAIHFLAFGTFTAAAAHGIIAGTDTQQPVVLGMYVATVAIVAMLLIVRTAQEAAAHQSATSRDPSPAVPTPHAMPQDTSPEMQQRLAALATRSRSGAHIGDGAAGR
jgi:hypothetical protein